MKGGAFSPSPVKEECSMSRSFGVKILLPGDQDISDAEKLTAKGIRKRTAIPGWHEDESKFPKAEYTDIEAMLVKAYLLGARGLEHERQR